MTYICIEFIDGTKREWRHEGRAGGSWTKTLELQDGWVTVRNEYGSTNIFPRDSIKEIITRE